MAQHRDIIKCADELGVVTVSAHVSHRVEIEYTESIYLPACIFDIVSEYLDRIARCQEYHAFIDQFDDPVAILTQYPYDLLLLPLRRASKIYHVDILVYESRRIHVVGVYDFDLVAAPPQIFHIVAFPVNITEFRKE